MKKKQTFIILGIVAITTNTTLSFEIDPDNPVQIAYVEQQRAEWQQAQQKALDGDDMALQDAIRWCYNINLGGYTGMHIDRAKELVELGISQERLIKVLGGMIREDLSAFEKDENAGWGNIYDFMLILKAFPDSDSLTLFVEYAQSKNETIRHWATEKRNAIVIAVQEQQGLAKEATLEKDTDDVTPPSVGEPAESKPPSLDAKQPPPFSVIVPETEEGKATVLPKTPCIHPWLYAIALLILAVVCTLYLRHKNSRAKVA